MRGIVLALVVLLDVASCWRGSTSPAAEPAQASQSSDPASPVNVPPDPRGPDKRRQILAMLQRGPVLVHLDARRPGVAVPAQHRNDNHLVLRVGYEMEPAIPDLLVGQDSLTATLTFNKQPFHVVVPWSALYAAMVEGEVEKGKIWDEDVPPGVLDEASQAP